MSSQFKFNWSQFKFLNLILNCIEKKNRGTSSIQLNFLIHQLTVWGCHACYRLRVKSGSPVWGRHKQHNQTERRAVEYCTVYLNQCRANGCNTCVSITCMRNVYVGMPRSGRSPSKVVSCTFLLHELPAWTASTGLPPGLEVGGLEV